MDWLVENALGIVLGIGAMCWLLKSNYDWRVGSALNLIAYELKRYNDNEERRDRERSASPNTRRPGL